MSNEVQQTINSTSDDDIPVISPTGDESLSEIIQPQKNKTKAASKSNNLIVLAEQEGAEQLARDINHKIDSMESHFERLTDVFSSSQDIFKSSMEDLQHRSTSLAEDIQQLSSRMEQGFSSHSHATKALEARLDASVEEFNQQIDRATNALHFQDTRIDELQLTSESLRDQLNETTEELNERLEINANSIGEQLSEIQALQREQENLLTLQQKLDHASEEHGKNIKYLSDKTRAQLAENQQEVEKIQAMLASHQASIDDLIENFRSVEEATETLGNKLAEVEVDLHGHRNLTKRNFKRVAYWGAGISTILLGGILTLQYYPVVIPEAVQSKLGTLNTEMAQQKLQAGALAESVNSLKEGQFSVEAQINDTESKIAAINFDLVQSESNLHALDEQQLNNRNLINQVDEKVLQLQRSVDNLDFKILGPGVASGEALKEGVTLQTSEWIAQQPSENYSIQLVGVYRFEHLISYINKNQPSFGDAPLSYNEGQRIGKPWYNLYYGSFESFSAAQTALDELPLRLKGSNPWIRSFGAIQKAQ